MSLPKSDRRRNPGAAFVRKSRHLLLALFLSTGCQAPSTHLAATRRVDGGGTVDARVVPADGGPGRDGPAIGCQETTVDLTVPKGNIVLVVERSDAMNTPNDSSCDSCGTYWDAAVEAIDQLTSATSNHFRWGLKLFPSPGAGDACSVSPFVDVPLTSDANAPIVSALRSSTAPSGGTPTTSAVGAVYAFLRTILDPAPRVIVLVMGGTPTCASGDPTLEDMEAAIAEVSQLPQPYVFVLGVGADRQKLDRLALAGSTLSAYSTDQIPDLLGAVEGWARTIAGCVFPLASPLFPGQGVTVSLDGVPLVLGDPNGFGITPDGSEVMIQGASCFYIGTYSTLTIRVGCGY